MGDKIHAAVVATAQFAALRNTPGAWTLHAAVTALWLDVDAGVALGRAA